MRLVYPANMSYLGSFYPPKLDDTIEMSKEHQDSFAVFDKTFPKEITEMWGDQVTAWDADHTQPNPYVEPAQGTSLAALKLELAREEAEEGVRGIFRTQERSITSFLYNALDLEDDQ